MYLQSVCFTKCFINKSQQYGRAPVYTTLCTLRLHVLLTYLLTNHSNMDAPQCVHPYVPSDCMFYEMFYYQITAIWTLSSVYTLMFLKTVCFAKCFINKSQQFGRSPLVTPVCTFRLYVLLNVLLTNHSNMDAPQFVHTYVPSDCMFY